ncbi:MAG: 30S ribosome-binding factor RbfA [Bryobacterales bacterium]|nr:30S ribosome-binding factor RbfA [Bryobacterales bacterium]
MDTHRVERVSEAVREELAEIIAFELQDPRLAAVDVTDVQVARDMRHAHVKVGIRGDAEAEHRSLNALEHARPYLRRQLASRLNLRRIPELHFEVDRFTEAESRVEILLRRARKTRGREEPSEVQKNRGENPEASSE